MPQVQPTLCFTSERAARACAAVGAAIVVVSSAPAAVSPGAGTTLLPLLLFVLWALVPYAVLVLLGRTVRWPWAILGAGAAAIAAEIGFRLAVFVFPRGSTAAIALVFSPLFLLLICMPVGAVAGYVVGRAMSSEWLWLRGAALVLGGASLALVTLGLARPDLFPTTVVARRQARERIGPIGVRAGQSQFEKALVHPTSGWRLTGEFDGAPGEEIAVIERDTIALLDPQTFATTTHLTLAGEAARWNWFSELARRDGQFVRVDIGGGYQATRVLALDGTLLWDYHPDPQLPPSALRPADLDGDGEAEFYATSQDRLVRLDGDGREVWRQTLINGSISTVTPPGHSSPGWVVTTTDGRSVTVWNKDGQALATVQAGAQGYRAILGALEWIGGRVLAFGGETLTLRTIDGTTAFEWTVDDMTVVATAVVRFSPDGPPALAIVAAAERDTRRSRLQIVGADRAILYDEVLETMPRLSLVTAADGTTTVLLGGAELRALRRRAAAS